MQPDENTEAKHQSTKKTGRSELIIESGEKTDQPAGKEIVVSDWEDGSSLTLVEEYAMRKRRVTPLEFSLSFLCAAASLAFATLLYIKTR